MNPPIHVAGLHKPFIVYHPTSTPIALVLDSPHSSTHIPQDMHAALADNELRDGEDLLVDGVYWCCDNSSVLHDYFPSKLGKSPSDSSKPYCVTVSEEKSLM
mgnify:CR=1 FL=1